tara:strand:- start:302 stop:616 length:315 start_codon:yes stop_codon:yes gene_type:complete
MILEELINIIKDRKYKEIDNSYTATLLNEGIGKCSKKFGEESIELIIAALQKDHENVKEEAADVIFHLLVLLEICKVDFGDILLILKKRMTKSGLEEKSNRFKK